MDFKIASLPGDGVGPEVVAEAEKIIKAIAKKYKHSFEFNQGLIGGVSIDATGSALTDDTIEMCRRCDAILLGAVGDPKFDDPTLKERPENGLLKIRKALGLFANLRPVQVLPMLIDSTNIKPEALKGVDMIVVRELTGGLYFGQPKKKWEDDKGRYARTGG